MSILDDDDDFSDLSLSQRAMMGARAADQFKYLDGLNEAQLSAVKALEGPVLILAGAGTGKTSTLMARATHLIRTGRALRSEILAVTFTNKAAREMADRLRKPPYSPPTRGEADVKDAKNLHDPSKELIHLPWMGTFHAICAKLLRHRAELVGLKSNFTILDTDDQIRLIKQLLESEGVDVKRWPPRLLASKIDEWKNRAYSPSKVPAGSDFELFVERSPLKAASQVTARIKYDSQYYSEPVRANDSDVSENEKPGASGRQPLRVVTAIGIYAAYQERLKTLNAVDFGDLLLHMVNIFQNYPDVLEQYQRRFKYILVDEYQDTNTAQYLWLRLLAQGHRNVCCVGDDDQSIYGWRGAEVGNILRFEKDFPGAVVVRLEQNYRSTEHILAAASGLISANSDRLGKELWTEEQGGEKVRLIGHWDGEEEARWIGEEIEALSRGTRGHDPVPLNGQAILVRASHQMRAFEDRFLTIGLPYRVIGGPRFYERQEIRDAMAYFRLAVSPDDDLAFERVVNVPKRGLGDKAQAKIQTEARAAQSGLVMGAKAVLQQGALGGKAAGGLRNFIEGVERWHAAVLEGADHVRLAETILEESGYTEMWLNDKTPEAPGRLENLKELVKALEQFENLQGFLEHVALIMDNDKSESEDKVSIMTLHAAKGLEFPAVFLPGWEEGLFPSQRALDESGQRALEEERRLAYVGITRAEEICTISFAGNRRVYGQWQSQLPSRFIDELPARHVEVLTPPGLYGGGAGAAAPVTGFGSLESRAARADVYNSPGWKRMESRATGAPKPKARTVTTVDSVAFGVGDRVFHVKFGYGEVIDLEGDTAMVEFEKAGSKHVKAGFLKPANAADDVPF